MNIEKSEVDEKRELQKIHRKLRNKKRRNIILNAITILLAIGGIIWASTYFLKYYKYEITNDATVEQYISSINSRLSGYISKIYFTDHQYVRKGDTLLIIDDREFRIKQMDAAAALKDAEASSYILNSTTHTSSMNVDLSEANMEEAKVRLCKSEQDYKKYQKLYESEAVSRQQLDQMKTEYEVMKAHYNTLAKQQQSRQSISTVTHKKRDKIDATIAHREADLAMADLNLSYTIITAPFSGFVGRRTLEEGLLIQAGQTITNLVKNDGKWIIANYREKQIANIYIGQEVKIKVDAINDKVFRGKVTAISEATGSKYSLLPTDNSAGNFVKTQQRIPVRIDFIDISEDDMKKMKAGMMVETEAILK